MRDYLNIYAGAMMVATRMDPLPTREPAIRFGMGWLTSLLRRPAGCTAR